MLPQSSTRRYRPLRRLPARDHVICALKVRAETHDFHLWLVAPDTAVTALDFVDLKGFRLVQEIIEAVGVTERVQSFAIGLPGLDDEGRDKLTQLRTSHDVHGKNAGPGTDFE